MSTNYSFIPELFSGLINGNPVAGIASSADLQGLSEVVLPMPSNEMVLAYCISEYPQYYNYINAYFGGTSLGYTKGNVARAAGMTNCPVMPNLTTTSNFATITQAIPTFPLPQTGHKSFYTARGVLAASYLYTNLVYANDAAIAARSEANQVSGSAQQITVANKQVSMGNDNVPTIMVGTFKKKMHVDSWALLLAAAYMTGKMNLDSEYANVRYIADKGEVVPRFVFNEISTYINSDVIASIAMTAIMAAKVTQMKTNHHTGGLPATQYIVRIANTSLLNTAMTEAEKVNCIWVIGHFACSSKVFASLGINGTALLPEVEAVNSKGKDILMRQVNFPSGTAKFHFCYKAFAVYNSLDEIYRKCVEPPDECNAVRTVINDIIAQPLRYHPGSQVFVGRPTIQTVEPTDELLIWCYTIVKFAIPSSGLLTAPLAANINSNRSIMNTLKLISDKINNDRDNVINSSTVIGFVVHPTPFTIQ